MRPSYCAMMHRPFQVGGYFLMTRLWSVSLPNSHCRKIGNGATGVSSAVNCFKRYVWKRT
ncbi:Uncharacterised protein [Vibrio cholerae]|nr:Uncharacterised protein [Vibrio cholerae]